MKVKNIEIVKTWPEGQFVKNSFDFLGFTNFYKKFIRNFSEIVALLNSLLQKISELLDVRFFSTKANNNK